eukprot:770180_1
MLGARPETLAQKVSPLFSTGHQNIMVIHIPLSRHRFSFSTHALQPGRQTSVMVGLSSFAISLPGFVSLYYTQSMDEQLFHAIVYIVASFCSFMSDYVYCGKTSHWHWIDAYTAATLVFVNGIRAIFYMPFYEDPSRIFLYPLGWIIPGYILCKSRTSKSDKDWRWWHAMWHFAGTFWLLVYVRWVGQSQTP